MISACLLAPALASSCLLLAQDGKTAAPVQQAGGAQSAAGDDALGTWEQWRGPARDGQYHGPAWPKELSDKTLSLAWKVEDLGASYATPLVTESHVFSVGTYDEDEEVVRAYDRASGDELWVARWDGAMKVPFFAAKNGSWVRSTPAFDGEALYVGGMLGTLVCLEGDSGKERWRVDFAERHEVSRPGFGLVCSPLVDGEFLYIQAGAAIEKLNKRTGETVWRSMEGSGGMDSVFSSPILAEVHGETQLVVQTRTHMAGLDPKDGEPQWTKEIKSFRGMNILTPLPYKDGFFTAAYRHRAQLLKLVAGDDGLQAEQQWEHRAQGYMTSPVLIDDHAYLFLQSNRFACVPMDGGDGGYTSEPTGDEYMSLIAQGDRILALSNTGMLRLIGANPEKFDVLGEVDLVDGKTWAHLAVADGQIVVREENSLYVWNWK